MPVPGEEKVIDGTKFIYSGYGFWEEIVDKTKITDNDGDIADIKENAQTGNKELLVNLEGVICEDNSSDDPLGAGISFNGDWQDTIDYGAISIGVVSDQDSADDGLLIQWSSDGTTVHDSDAFSIFANKGKTFSFGPARRYLKLVYTNGGVTQTFFNLQTALRRVYVKPSSHRVNDDIVGQDDAELVTTVMKVQTNDNNTFKNVDVQNPLPTDGDSVYGKDLDLANSITTGWVGDLSDLFGDLTVGLSYTGTTNPKNITVKFRRTVLTHATAFSANTGNFSNLKLIALLGGGLELPLYDGSADNTDRTSQSIQFSPIGIDGFRLEFHTVDDVVLSNVVAFKTLTTVSRLQAISELSGVVENINSFRGALKVDTALVHKEGVNLFFFRETGVGSTLAVAAAKGDTAVTVVDGTGFALGDRLRLTSDIATGQPFLVITVVAVNVITLDRPLVIDLGIGDAADIVTTQLNEVGTLASPVIFQIKPPNGNLNLIWQLTRLMISVTDGAAMDDGKFGGITALGNGVVLRVVKGDGSIQELTNWKTNGDMALDMYDITYTDKAPAGENGLRGRWTFTKAEFIVELDGAEGDQFQLLIQDDLSALTSYEIKSQGRLFGA